MNARRNSAFYALALVFGGAIVLHLWGVGNKALWYDEVTTAVYGAMPLAKLARILAAEDFHPPLYFLLQRPFLALPLPVEWQLRLVPLAAAAAAAVLAELTVRALGGPRWVAGLLAAFFPGLVVYAQEARAYAALTALEFAALYAFARARRDPEHVRWPALGLAALWVAAAMHYLAVLFVVPLGLALVWATRRRRATALVALGLAGLYAPWLPVAYRSFFTAASPLAAVAAQPMGPAAVWGVFAPHWGGDLAAVLAALATLGLVAYGLARRRAEAVVAAALLVFPWVLFLAVPPRYPFFHPRYFLPWAAVPLVVLPFLPRAPRWAAAGMLGVAFVWAGVAHVAAPRVWNRELAAHAAELFEPGDLLIVEPYYQSIALFYYLPLPERTRESVLADPLRVYPGIIVDPNGVPVAATSLDALAQIVGNAPLSERAYVLVYGPLPERLKAFSTDLVEVERWPQATLYRFNKRVWADREAGWVYVGSRPVAKWVPRTLEKQF